MTPERPERAKMNKLKFSSVQQPELIGYLTLLKISVSNLEIEEVIGQCGAVKPFYLICINSSFLVALS